MSHLFDSFRIGHFRGFTDVELTDCGAVNLLIGANNSGKSSILEALALYARPFDQGEWVAILRRRDARGRRTFSMDDLWWLFSHGQPVPSITLSSTGLHATKSLEATADRITRIKPPDDSAEWSTEQGLSIKVWAGPPDAHERRILEFWPSVVVRTFDSALPEVELQSLTPFSHRIEPEQVRAFTEATMGEWKSEVLELLRQIDPAILNLEILDPTGTSSTLGVKYNGLPIAPLSTLGDGLRRIISIALAVGNLKNGLLLIDEIESAVHVSALETVFPWLTAACKKNNVQLFATTHSLEALDALLETPEGNEMACYRLYRPGQPERIQRIAPDLLRRLRTKHGLDVRLAR